MSTIQSSWQIQYDPALRNHYYLNTANGSIRFDSPHEVRRTELSDEMNSSSVTHSNSSQKLVSAATNLSQSSSFSSGSASLSGSDGRSKKKFKFLSKLPKLSLCSRSKSKNSAQEAAQNSSQSPSQSTFQNVLPQDTRSQQNRAASYDSYDSSIDHYGIIADQRHDGNYTTAPTATSTATSAPTPRLEPTFNPYYNDNASVVSVDSYVSSIDESVINENVNIFYHQDYNNSQDPYYHHSSRASASSNRGLYSVVSSNRSLTIMNPDEFRASLNGGLSADYVRGNIDDYASDIESLHDDSNREGSEGGRGIPVLEQSNGGIASSSSVNTVDTAVTTDFENQVIGLYASNTSSLFNNSFDQFNNSLLTKQLHRELLRYEEDLAGY